MSANAASAFSTSSSRQPAASSAERISARGRPRSSASLTKPTSSSRMAGGDARAGEQTSCSPTLLRIWPSPKTTNFSAVSSRAPIGPKAWSLVVEMPISAPRPSSKPSAKRVEALTSTVDEFTSRRKRIARGVALGDDGLGVVGAVALDVLDRLVDRIHHANGEHLGEELGVVVVLGGAPMRQRHRPGSPALRSQTRSSTPSSRQRARDREQQARRRLAVDQQRLGGVAHRRPLHLAVDRDRHRLGGVGVAIDVGVADALVVLDHRNARVLDHEADQALAAARDHQVDQVVLAQQLARRRGGRWCRPAGSPPGRSTPPRARRAVDAAMARLEWIASEPPRSTTALPALRQSAAASAVTLGRDS